MKIIMLKVKSTFIPLQAFKYQMLKNVNERLNSKAMTQVLKEYNMNDIKQAINSVYVAGNYICIPNSGKDNMILRLLQYGGPGVKALNLLTLTGNQIGGDNL